MGRGYPPPGVPPAAPAYFPQPQVPQPPLGGVRYQGTVISYDHGKGFGFINCAAIPTEDVYLQKKELPAQAKEVANLSLKGRVLEFEVFLTGDGKPRATRIVILGEGNSGKDRDRKRERDRGDEGAGPPAALDVRTVQAMTRFLEDKGGAMDFGKFTREFKAVKKSQLEEHFNLVAEENDKGGRWQIMLLDMDPQSVQERRPRKQEKTAEHGPEARNDTPMGHFEGVINAYDGAKGYGFIKSEEVQEGDVYFRKAALPPEARSMQRADLFGARVEFDGVLTPDGKPRAESIAITAYASAETEKEAEATAVEPPTLSEEQIQEMRDFLEEQGGAMDYGRFANKFPGVKKAQLLQLETDFTLVQQDSTAGGRWLITLPGVDPEAVMEAEEARPHKGPAPAVGEAIRPSGSFWLIGCVKKWDPKKHFGFLVADGADDVFVHRNDLPEEMKSIRQMLGIEMAFELDVSEEGKLKAKTVRPLIQPDATGGWQFRRV